MAVEQHGTFGNTVSDVTRQGKYRQLEGEYDFDEDPGNVLAELDDRNNMVVRLEAADAIAFLVLLAIAGTVVRHDHVTGSLGLSHGW